MSLESKVIRDFGEQWTSFERQDGEFVAPAHLEDILAPLMSLEELRGRAVCEIGCGNGRFLRTLGLFAEHATGVEPSDAAPLARAYTSDLDNVSVEQRSVYDLRDELNRSFDTVFCIGVLHHLPEPVRALEKMRALLRDGQSKLVVWVYGREGNELYLRFVEPLRRVTTKLPHAFLRILAYLLAPILWLYIRCCRFVRLPMRAYMRNVLAKLDFYYLVLNIYDQLNPGIAVYWTRSEVERLLTDAGFGNVVLHHRHGYSWTAVANRDGDRNEASC